MTTYVHLWQYLSEFLLEWEIFQTKFIEQKQTFYVQELFLENRAVYELRWKNIVHPDRRQMTIWIMRIECWIPKATKTQSE
jgi:hypothetical protein